MEYDMIDILCHLSIDIIPYQTGVVVFADWVCLDIQINWKYTEWPLPVDRIQYCYESVPSNRKQRRGWDWYREYGYIRGIVGR